MSLVEATYQGANILLAHFHHACKGYHLFQHGFDWNSRPVQRIAELDGEQLQFMKDCQQEVIRQGETSPYE